MSAKGLGSICQNLLERNGIAQGRILVAVSGGRDSRVLLDLLGDCAPALGLELIVGHVNHQLRGEASRADEAFVEAIAARMGVAFESRRVDPEILRSNRSSRERPSLEEAARALRRSALMDLAAERNADWIATAHHAGDQAETVLLRILRGTGPDGLAAMAPVSHEDRIIRPLLGVTPEAIEAFARARALDWREDASNQDRGFTRNRLRLDALPGLAESFNPQLLRTLCNLAEAQRRDLEWIGALVDQAAEGRIETQEKRILLALDGWDSLPEALARRLVRRALIAVGLDRELTRGHLERVLACLCRGRAVGRDKIIELPCGIRLRRADDSFFELGPIRTATGSGDHAASRVHDGFDRPENATVLARD